MPIIVIKGECPVIFVATKNDIAVNKSRDKEIIVSFYLLIILILLNKFDIYQRG